MSRAHPLARRREIELSDLKASTLVIFPRAIAPGLYDEMIAASRAGGYRPTHRTRAAHDGRAAAVGGGRHVRPRVGLHKGRGSRMADLVWKPIVGEPIKWWTSVVRRKSDSDPLTLKTAQVILRGLEKHDQWQRLPKRDH